MKIFIADDSKLVRARLREQLEEIPGVEIIGEAADGHKAVEGIGNLHPDLVILDIRMPGRDGMGVLEEIKGWGKSPRVIMLTNFPYPQYRRKCKDSGADYFLDKSEDFESIQELVRQQVHGKEG